MIYVRHQLGWSIGFQPQPPRVFEPLTVDHPLVTDEMVCFACDERFEAGDRKVLVPLGPGNDPEAREKAKAGRFYNAVAVAIHADCAGVTYATVPPTTP